MTLEAQMDNKQPSLEEGFQEALKDVISIVTKLGPHCKDLSHLLEICQLGINNESQLHFLLRLTQAKR